MNNINVRVVGTANMTQMGAGFGKVQAQVTALNAQLAQMVALQNGVDPTGYENMARAGADNAKVFRSAVASTGMFNQQQLKVNSATDDYIEKLKRQKLSFRDLARERKTAAAAYKEQLAMENMVVRSDAGSNGRGKQNLDVIYPKQVSGELDTATKRMAWFNEQVKSGAHQMVNWGKNTQWAGRQLTVGFTMPLLAAGAAAGVLAYKVDQEFTRIAKVYDTTANANSQALSDQMAVEKELADLREAGMQTSIMAARNYGASAQDTLNVQGELAATGIKGNELQKSTAEVMRIARLGELDYQDALGATISLQTVFRQSSDELTESFNYMNSIENATSLTTQDFAQAIPIAAAPIREFGGDIQELGILLTAMKSRGIEATQGANAIKAAMQRLGRPSKQVSAEFKEITGTDISQLVDTSDSLTEIFQRLREETKDLSAPQRRDVLSGLFGSYQVTRMSALVDGMEDLETGYGQTARAAEIAGQSTESWASTAEREIDRLNSSVSAKFKNALAEVQVQMATLGRPFIEVATVVLKGVSKLIAGFNKLPNLAKWGIAMALGLTALAGPVIMLVGLFANLAGNLIRFGTSVLGAGVKMEILSKEGRAAKLAADLASSGFITERTAVQQLTVELNKLALAQQAANAANGMAPAASAARAGANTVSGSATIGAMNLDRAMPGPTQVPNATGPGAIIRGREGPQLPNDWKSKQVNYQYESAALREKERSQQRVTDLAAKEATARERSVSATRGAAAGTAVMGAAMATSLVSTNSTVDGFANMIIMAGLLIPAVKGIGSLTQMAAKKAKDYAAAQRAAAVTSRDGLGTLKQMRITTGGIVKSLAKAIGPGGLLVAGLVAVGAIIYKQNKDRMQAIEDNLNRQKRLNSAAEEYASSIGKSYNEWKKIKTTAVDTPELTDYEQDKKYFSESENGKQQVEDFKGLSGAEQQTAMMERYIELVARAGVSTDRAKTALSAFYQEATGTDAISAGVIADEIGNSYGELKNFNWSKIMSDYRSGMDDALADFGAVDSDEAVEARIDVIKEEAKKIGGVFSQALSTAASPQEAQKAVDAFSEVALRSINGFTGEIDKAEPQIGAMWDKLLSQNNLSGDAAQLQEWYSRSSRQQITDAFSDAGFNADQVYSWVSKLDKASQESSLILNGYVGNYTDLGDSIGSLGDLADNFNIASLTMPLKDAQKEVKGLVDGLFSEAVTSSSPAYSAMAAEGILPEIKKVEHGFKDVNTEFIKLQNADPVKFAQMEAALKAFANANNIKLGANAARTYFNILNNVKNQTTEVGNEASKAAEKIQQSWRMSGEAASEMQKGAMEATQQDMADAFREDFDARMQNALDARQAVWDKRLEGQENAFERENDALENKWEKKKDGAEKYWDRRVENIDRAIKAEQEAEDKRKKMFDAEIARINRLNEAANRNIDFNTALNTGNFDEAAKIRNDMTASAAQATLERAGSAGTEKSERRVTRLEGKTENLEEARDKYMKDLDKREEAERRHLAKSQKVRGDALKRESDADMKTQKKIWDSRKKNLEAQLDLFLSYIAKNEKDLRRHMKDVGLAYTDFGGKLMKKGDMWAKHFGDTFKKNLREAGLKMASDKMWSKLGERSLKEVLKGMGFKGGMAEFRSFISTGKMGGSAGTTTKASKKGKPGTIKPSFGAGGGIGNNPANPTIQHRHEGGEIGSGMGSRKGVARTLKGQHQNEQLVRAQKGEFMVNKTAAQQHKGLLTAINNGQMNDVKMNSSRTNTGSGVGGDGNMGGGLAGMIASVAARGVTAGIAAKMESVYAEKQASLAAMSSGLFSAGLAGMYGDRSFSAEQLGNAATIASVGSGMGMSARDIMIGIMTAITESGLINIHGGDRDSQGLFQQRPSQGWGTVAQVTDPTYAATKFFESLKGISGRAAMDPWAAAQAVQRSAFSDGSNYKTYWDEANAIFNRGLVQTPAYGGAPGDRKYNLPGVKPWVNEAAQYLGNKFNIGTIGGVGGRPNASDHPSGHALDFMTSNKSQGDALAAEVVRIHDDLDSTYAIWRQRITSANGGWGNWRPMEDRGSPTANHMDHVHVSFDRSGDLGDLPSLGDTGLMGPMAPTGRGGLNKPSVPGKGWRNSHDYANGVGSPLYAYNNGVVTTSKATTSGGTPGNGRYRDPASGRGYTSYGETITIRGDDGSTVLYAHLSPGKRFVNAGARVRGGQLIGLSGETGNASGPHTHFTTNGTYNAQSFFQGKGIPLKTGGTIKKDGTPAILHKNERVLTANLTKKLDEGIENMHENSKKEKNTANSKKSNKGDGEGGNKGKKKTKKTGDAFELMDWAAIAKAKKDANRKKAAAWKYPELMTGAADTPYTWFGEESLTEANKATAAVSKAMSLRTGTYNVKFSSSNQATQGDLTKLFKMADILSLTEMANGKRGLAPWIAKQGWGYYSPNTKVHNETGIAWNKSVMDMVKGGTMPINPIHGGHHGWDTHRMATYGMFEKKDSGAQFWQIAAHTVGRAQKVAGAEAIMQEQYGNLGRLVERLQATGAPVILAGDLNTAPERHKYKFKFGDLVDSKSGSLDRSLASKGSKLAGQKRVGGLTSDHMALLSQYNIPGLRVGGDVKWDNTIANLHKDERVLTKPLTAKLDQGIDNFANGPQSTYNLNVNVTQPDASADEIANVVMTKLKRHEQRKPGSRN